MHLPSQPFPPHLQPQRPFQTIPIPPFFALPIKKQLIHPQFHHQSLPLILPPPYKIQQYPHPHKLQYYHQQQHAVTSVL
ncbi:putative inorganic carbon transporter subunit DabA, partial [Staphylococcus pasteuri]|uniref:putative inorganic carbon transporter subunit DabA n=1 Tax=Staphylococcus pasteuri TaxID=45972 RepID=UPI0036F2EB4B